MGALLLLLVLVPLIPTGVMLRMMYEAVAAEQEAARERVRAVHRQALTVATASLAARLPAEADREGAVRRFYERTFDPTVQVRLVPPGAADEGEALAESSLDEVLPGWRVQLRSTPGGHLETSASGQVAIYGWAAAIAVGLNLLIAGLAAVGVRRQLQLHELKSHSLATLSHELKTPLASMRVLLDTIRAGRVRDPAAITEYAAMLTLESDRLERLTTNFLGLARMEGRGESFHRAEARPETIAAAAVNALGSKLQAENVVFATTIGESLPLLCVDNEAIVTVLVNLLENALKYTGETKRITLRVSRENRWVSFEVEDNGIGIARRERRRIFERFYQTDQRLSRMREGCGLGLSIVKHIIDAHRGSISITSEVGQGSLFTVRLPVAT